MEKIAWNQNITFKYQKKIVNKIKSLSELCSVDTDRFFHLLNMLF